MSGQRHPDAAALARFRSGSRETTPVPRTGFRDRRVAAHVARCPRCAATIEQLDAVSAILASVAAPAMPEAVERRVTAALAAEAAARGAASETGAPAGTGPRRARPRAAGTGPRAAGTRRRGWRPRPVMLLVPAVACLLLAGFGYLLSNGGTPARSTGGQAAAPESPLRGASSPGPGSAGKATSPSGALAPLEQPGQASFLVSSTGTSYKQATLAAQVRAQLANRPAAAPAPGGSAPAAHTGTAGSQAVTGSGSVPSPALVGCVLHITGKVAPSLVDEATYQGKPAYVIAVPGRAWVVGPDCTASDSALITSISLSGAG